MFRFLKSTPTSEQLIEQLREWYITHHVMFFGEIMRGSIHEAVYTVSEMDIFVKSIGAYTDYGISLPARKQAAKERRLSMHEMQSLCNEAEHINKVMPLLKAIAKAKGWSLMEALRTHMKTAT